MLTAAIHCVPLKPDEQVAQRFRQIGKVYADYLNFSLGVYKSMLLMPYDSPCLTFLS